MNENEKDLPEEEIEEELPETETDEDFADLDEDPEEDLNTDEDEVLDEDGEEDAEDSEDEDDGKSDSAEETKSAVAEEPTKKEESKPTASKTDKEYKRLLRDTRRALEALGIKTDNDDSTLTEIVKLAAEQSNKTVEEYNKYSDEEDEFLEYKRLKDEKARASEEKQWEDRFKKDLEAIQAEFPEAKKYTHLSQLPNWKRFGELMETGRMTAVEAFKLSHPREADAKIAAGVKQASLNDTKAHLRSSVPKSASGGAVHISKSEMDTYRDMFPDLSDAEIRKYHAKATRK